MQSLSALEPSRGDVMSDSMLCPGDYDSPEAQSALHAEAQSFYPLTFAKPAAQSHTAPTGQRNR